MLLLLDPAVTGRQVQLREMVRSNIPAHGVDHADVSAFNAHHDPLQLSNRKSR